jgi:hypothetical protein
MALLSPVIPIPLMLAIMVVVVLILVAKFEHHLSIPVAVIVPRRSIAAPFEALRRTGSMIIAHLMGLALTKRHSFLLVLHRTRLQRYSRLAEPILGAQVEVEACSCEKEYQ